MEENIKKKFELYIDVFESISDVLKWKADRQVIMLISVIYTIHNKLFNLEEFIELSDYIKKDVSFFSPLRSPIRFTLSAILITKYDHPKEQFKRFKKIYHLMTKNGFKKNSFSVISSLALMNENSYDMDDDLIKSHVKKALAIYKGMKQKHFFLTESSDYPLAILLAKSEKDVESLIKDIEHYYNNLANQQFKKGNDLQFLSHILMILEQGMKGSLVDHCQLVYHKLQRNMKVKKSHYPAIGLLSVTEDADDLIQEIINFQTQLNGYKKFRFYKDLNFIISVIVVTAELIKDDAISETSISTTIEMLIEAQQTAIIAAIGATTIISTGGSSAST